MSRKLQAIMFTDIKGFSSMMSVDEDRTVDNVLEHRAIVRAAIERHGGHEHGTIGDAFVVLFDSAVAAVDCAIDMQSGLRDRNARVAPDDVVRIRVGIHVGEVLHREGDIYGDGVNLAARVEPQAEPGGICITAPVHRQVRNRDGAFWRRVGVVPLKNIDDPPALYAYSATPVQRTRSPSAAVVVATCLALACAAVVAIIQLVPRDSPTPSLQEPFSEPPRVVKAERLTSDPGAERVGLAAVSGDLVAWSVDGTVRLLNRSDGSVRELPAPRPGRTDYISWTEDGRRLVIEHLDDSGLTVFSVDPASASWTALTRGGAPGTGPDGALAWLDDGDVWLQTPGASARKLVSRNTVFTPAFSPSGRFLAIVALRDQSTGLELEVVDVRRGQVRQITPPGSLVHGAVWASEDRLLFLQQAPPPAHGSELHALRMVDGAPVGSSEQLYVWPDRTAAGLRIDPTKTQLTTLVTTVGLDVSVTDSRNIALRRLTFDDRADWLTGWLDDDTVMFVSDRAGHFDVYQQKTDATLAQRLIATEGQETWATPVPDSDDVLYWRLSGSSAELVRGGPDQPGRVLLTRAVPARRPAAKRPAPTSQVVRCVRTCLLAEFDEGKLVLFPFDPDTGELGAPWKPTVARSPLSWSLAADGRVATWSGPTIQVLDNGDVVRSIASETRVNGVAWGQDALWVARGRTGSGTLARIGLDGTVYEQLDASIVELATSPDGAKLAMTTMSYSADNWLLTDF